MVCIDRNSEIIGYVLRYGEASSDQREEAVTAGSGDEGGTSTITGLTPYTEYSIEVAAVNSDSQTGPFANIAARTLQDSEYINSVSFSIAALSLWSLLVGTTVGDLSWLGYVWIISSLYSYTLNLIPNLGCINSR